MGGVHVIFHPVKSKQWQKEMRVLIDWNGCFFRYVTCDSSVGLHRWLPADQNSARPSFTADHSQIFRGGTRSCRWGSRRGGQSVLEVVGRCSGGEEYCSFCPGPGWRLHTRHVNPEPACSLSFELNIYNLHNLKKTMILKCTKVIVRTNGVIKK